MTWLRDKAIYGLLRASARIGAPSTRLSRLYAAKVRGVPLAEQIAWDVFPRPHYWYGTYHAALQARALGVSAITAIEFGVAGGAGLLELERAAFTIESETGVEIQVLGFDTGTGMPASFDPRDLPYVWKSGYFVMDQELLRSRLTRARLVLGDVAETAHALVREPSVAPIGFVAFDLDYYSSTVAALRVFDGPSDRTLPRVLCYLDDCIGDDWELHSEFAGELLAIREFNDRHEHRKIAKIHGLSHKRRIPSPWNEVMFTMHDFAHPAYCTHIYPAKDWDLPLD